MALPKQPLEFACSAKAHVQALSSLDWIFRTEKREAGRGHSTRARSSKMMQRLHFFPAASSHSQAPCLPESTLCRWKRTLATAMTGAEVAKCPQHLSSLRSLSQGWWGWLSCCRGREPAAVRSYLRSADGRVWILLTAYPSSFPEH